MSTTRTWTDEELMALPRDGFKRELVDGEIRVSPAGMPHDVVILRLGARLVTHVDAHGLGWAAGSSAGVRMPSGNVRSPDVTFVSHGKLPGGLTEGFLAVVPDLVVEVLSPGDSKRLIADKVGEYLESGVRLVWVIDPVERTAAVHRSLTDVTALTEDDDLSGEDVVPGFRCRLRDVLL